MMKTTPMGKCPVEICSEICPAGLDSTAQTPTIFYYARSNLSFNRYGSVFGVLLVTLFSDLILVLSGAALLGSMSGNAVTGTEAYCARTISGLPRSFVYATAFTFLVRFLALLVMLRCIYDYAAAYVKLSGEIDERRYDPRRIRRVDIAQKEYEVRLLRRRFWLGWKVRRFTVIAYEILASALTWTKLTLTTPAPASARTLLPFITIVFLAAALSSLERLAYHVLVNVDYP